MGTLLEVASAHLGLDYMEEVEILQLHRLFFQGVDTLREVLQDKNDSEVGKEQHQVVNVVAYNPGD